MSTPVTGRQRLGANLPAVQPPAKPIPLNTAKPSPLGTVRPRPLGTVRPSPGAVQANPAGPGTGLTGRDLAAEDRLRHAQLRSRARLLHATHSLGARVAHPDGGQRAVDEILQDEASQRAMIEADRINGSRKHDRLPHWIHHVPKLVLIYDFTLLLCFFAGIADVDWGDPKSAALAFATVLAATVTVMSYGFFTFTGHQLRGYRDHSGAVRTHALDCFTKAAGSGSIAGIAVLATLMFVRIRADLLLGRDSGDLSLVVALALAIVTALANFLIIAIHAHDGSYEVDRLNRLSATARHALAAAHHAQGKAVINVEP